MKKIIIAGSLLIAAGVAHAGLLDAVTDTATAVTSAKDSGVSADQAVKAILKTKFQENVTTKEGANKRGNSSRLTQSFHFFMFEPIFSPVNALNQPI